MDDVHPLSCVLLNGGGCAAVLSGPWCAASLRPALSSAWCEYCDHVMLLFVANVRCVVQCVSAVFVRWGDPPITPPRRGGRWGHCGWRGGIVRWGGMVIEGRVLQC